jgi:hypothetical protein
MTTMLRKLASFTIFMAVFTVLPAYADTVVKRGNTTYIYKGDKPPIVIDTGRRKYIIASESEKMREILLRADRIKVVRKKKDNDDWREDYYKNYYRHHKNIRDHEDDPHSSSYNSGYGAGYLLSKDRD